MYIQCQFQKQGLKTAGGDPREVPTGSFWFLLPSKGLLLHFLSFLPFLPPSLSPFALDLSIQLVYHENGDLIKKPGMKRISLCEDLFVYCSSFHDCLWSDECLCLRGMCLCIRNFRWLWDHDSDSWVLDSKVLGPQARNHFYKQHLYGNGFLCFQLVQLIWHSIWNYLKSLNFCSFCLYLQGITGLWHCTWFVWYWESNLGLHVCCVSTLSTQLHYQPVWYLRSEKSQLEDLTTHLQAQWS